MTHHRLASLGLVLACLRLLSPTAVLGQPPTRNAQSGPPGETAPPARGAQQPNAGEARNLLRQALRKLAGLQSLAYTADYEFVIADPRVAAPEADGDPTRLEAPPVFLEGSAPGIRQRATATVTWQRLPAAPETQEPRVRFGIVGEVRNLGPVRKEAPGERGNDRGDPPAREAAVQNPAPPARGEPATPLRITFNGTLLRTLVPSQRQLLEYDSLDGEFPISALGLFLPLLDMGFLPGPVTPETEPAGTEVVALAPARVDDQPCHVLEVRIPFHASEGEPQFDGNVQDSEPGKGPRLVQIRRWFLAESDLLPRRMMVFPLQLDSRPRAGGEDDAGNATSDAHPVEVETRSDERPDAAGPAGLPGIAPGMRGREAPPPSPTVVTFRDLRPAIAVQPDDFELAVPEGYELREVVDNLVSNLETGDSLPDFEWQSAKGQPAGWREVSADLVLLAFWATWDQPNCRITLQLLQELHDEFGDRGLTVTGVSLDADEEEIGAAKRYVSKRKLTYRMFYNASDFAEDIGLRSIPHVMLLDSEGRVLYQHTGDEPKTEKRLRKAIESRLKPGAVQP